MGPTRVGSDPVADHAHWVERVRAILLLAAKPAAPCVPRNSKSGHQLMRNNQGGMLSLSPGWRTAVGRPERDRHTHRPRLLVPLQ